MIQVVVLVTIAALFGSLVFQLQRNSSDLLYFHGNSWSCTTKQEWTWMAVTGLLMLLLHAKATKRLDLPSEHDKKKLLLWFLVMNVLWFSAAISEIQFTFSAVRMLAFVGGKSAWPAMWNLAFIIFPIKRSSELLAISHKDNLFLHIWAGQAIFFWLAVHTVFLSIAYITNHDYSIKEWINVMVPSGDLYTEGVVNFMGWLGLGMFLVLWITSRPWFRKHYYETFSLLHLVSGALFVLFSNLHDYNTIHFIQPAFAAWIAERLVRRIPTLDVSVYSHELTSISNDDGILSNGGILAISTCEPKDFSSSGMSDYESTAIMECLSWNRSISLPEVPVHLELAIASFSISAIDADNMTFSVHIKALGDWTNQFVQEIKDLTIQSETPLNSRETGLADSNESGFTGRSQYTTATFKMCIEGPYHSDPGAPSGSDQKCLFVAGGVGLTGLSEVLYRRHLRGQAIQLVWILRTIEEMEFLAKDLLDRLQPPRDTTRIMVFITLQNQHHKHHRRAQSAIVNHETLLKTDDSRCFGDSAATGSSMTLATTAEETSRYPSMRSMAFVSLLGVALSFLLARLVCCNRTVRDIESGRILHTCSAVPRDSTSMTCSNSCQDEDEEGEGAPCCTTSICFYCFRGLPVLFMFFLAPVLPFLFAKMYPSAFQAMRWLRRCCMTHQGVSGYGNCIAPLPVTSRDVPQLEDAFHSSAVKDDAPTATTNLNHTTIEYRKPVLSQIVADFCASISSRSHNHDFDWSHNISDVESADECRAETEEASVFVCGSKALADSLLHEVEIHNLKGFKSMPSHGARRVHLSVWTATGAY